MSNNATRDGYGDVRSIVEDQLRYCWTTPDVGYGPEGIPEGDLCSLVNQVADDRGLPDVSRELLVCILKDMETEEIAAQSTVDGPQGACVYWRPFGTLRRIDRFYPAWEEVMFWDGHNIWA